MNIRVIQFAVRHNGQIYKPGEIFEVENEAGKKLVAESNGELEELPTVPTQQTENIGTDGENKTGDGTGEDSREGTGTGADGLPPIDPAETVKNKK